MINITQIIQLLIILPFIGILFIWFPKIINLIIMPQNLNFQFNNRLTFKNTFVNFFNKGNRTFNFLCHHSKGLSLIITIQMFILSCILFWYISFKNNNFIDILYLKIMPYHILNEDKFILIGVDGISLFLILLTTFLFALCNIAAFNIKKYTHLFFSLFLLLECFILTAFLVLDFLVFYILFEVLLIPMFLIIGIWGSRTRRMKAANYFLFYAFFGSLFMLIGILIIYYTVGNTNWYSSYTFNYNLEIQKILWFLFFIGFAIKVPLWPFHIWLPEAHVEAPTVGSIILAGLLLKLGGYGFLRFVLPIFTDATKYFLPLVITLCVIGIIYASLTTLRQVDMKRIIAYSSVAHMSYGMLGIFSLNYYGILGGIIIMLAHGLVSSALFYLVGILYDIYGTRLIKYYGGLVHVMPLFSVFFFFFTIANMGLPGLFIFVGEFLVTIGILINNVFAGVVSVLAGVLTVGYMILLYNRIIFGTLKIHNISYFKDLSLKDFIILFLLAFFTLFFGLYPQILIQNIEFSIWHTLRLYDI